jgi:hypothetical protein
MILDYAGPRKRSTFRLASASLLESSWTGAVLIIRERLAGQTLAVVAIALTFIMMCSLVRTVVHESLRRFDLSWIIVTGLFIAGWVAVVLAVIRQTWRETVLRIGDGVMQLSMGTPFTQQNYHRSFDQIHSIRVIGTQVADGAPLLAEMEILADNLPPVRLFTDHPLAHLSALAGEIDRAVHGPAAPF